MSDTLVQTPPKPFGWKVLGAFVAFFALIIVVNTIFIYTALKTHTGVITEKAYEKGLKHDQILQKARENAQWSGRPSFENGALQWLIKDEMNTLLSGLNVEAKFVRPVQDGFDFKVQMEELDTGIYRVAPEFPLHGLWKVYLLAKDAQGREFRMSYSVQAK